MDTIDTLDVKLNNLTKIITIQLDKARTPKNVLITKDKNWGKRSITLDFRLDELDIHLLKRAVGDIEKHLLEYEQLRILERELIDRIEIEKVVQKSIISTY